MTDTRKLFIEKKAKQFCDIGFDANNSYKPISQIVDEYLKREDIFLFDSNDMPKLSRIFDELLKQNEGIFVYLNHNDEGQKFNLKAILINDKKNYQIIIHEIAHYILHKKESKIFTSSGVAEKTKLESKEIIFSVFESSNHLIEKSIQEIESIKNKDKEINEVLLNVVNNMKKRNSEFLEKNHKLIESLSFNIKKGDTKTQKEEADYFTWLICSPDMLDLIHSCKGGFLSFGDMEKYLTANNIQFETKSYIAVEGSFTVPQSKVIVVWVSREDGKPINKAIENIQTDFELCYFDSRQRIEKLITQGKYLED